MDTIATISPFKKIYKDFLEITKARLAISVVFSSIAGYLLGFNAEQPFSWTVLLMLSVGGYCMVGASNAFNQVIEKDLDLLMDRTKNRPVPSGSACGTVPERPGSGERWPRRQPPARLGVAAGRW